MFSYFISAVLVLAVADGAAIAAEPPENKTNEIRATIQEYMDEAREFLNMTQPEPPENKTNEIRATIQEYMDEAREFLNTNLLEPPENKTNEIRATIQEYMDEATEFLNTGMKDVNKWIEEDQNETRRILQEEVNEAESWLKGIGNVTEDWTEEKFNEIGNEVQELVPKVSGDDCLCYQKTCGCCVHAVEPEIHLNSTVCVNVTYLAEDYGISLTLTLNNHTLYNETVSVRNPPPICIDVPYVKELADACVRLYDIDTSGRKFHACARLEARMKFIIIAHYDLGCFTIGSSVTDKIDGPEAPFQPSVLMI